MSNGEEVLVDIEVGGVNLDELQGEAKKLAILLEYRQLGSMSWHSFLHERLTNLHALASKALGK